MTTAISPRELRAAVVEGRAALQAVLHEAHHAWEKQPPHAEGAEVWSPRQVAQHVIGAELYFASGISQACGAPAIEMQRPDVSSPAAAAASLTRYAATCDNVLRHVSEGDLAKTHTMRQGELTVQRMMEILASHLHDHAGQIRAAVA
jgi:hypothetical protein